mgnify:FL=1
MSDYELPFHMTDRITSLIAEISEQVGRITVLQGDSIGPHLRRENRIRTIHSSLAIEHNSLSLEQVTAILDGKRVLGNPNEIREVQNAYAAYEFMLNQKISVVGRKTDQDSDQDRTPVERLLIALGSETLSTTALMKRLLLCFLHKIEAVARLFRATAPSRPTQKEPCRGRSSATVLFYSKPYSSSFSSPGCSMFHLSLRRVKRAGTSTVSLS